MFVAVLERELGDAGFVEVAEACGNHAPTQGTALVTTVSWLIGHGGW